MSKIRQGYSVPSDDVTGTKLSQTLTRSVWFSRVPLLLSGSITCSILTHSSFPVLHSYSLWLSHFPVLLCVTSFPFPLLFSVAFPFSTFAQ